MDVPKRVAQDLADALFDLVHELGKQRRSEIAPLFEKQVRRARLALIHYGEWLEKK